MGRVTVMMTKKTGPYKPRFSYQYAQCTMCCLSSCHAWHCSGIPVAHVSGPCCAVTFTRKGQTQSNLKLQTLRAASGTPLVKNGLSLSDFLGVFAGISLIDQVSNFRIGRQAIIDGLHGHLATTHA